MNAHSASAAENEILINQINAFTLVDEKMRLKEKP
jgi:hypothetical protein